MPIDITYAEGNNVTVTNTETSLAVDGGSTTLQTLTDVGIYTVVLDFTANMIKGDEYRWRLYEEAQGSDDKDVIMEDVLLGVQSHPLTIECGLLGIGWDFTFQRISSTSRAGYWTVRRVHA